MSLKIYGNLSMTGNASIATTHPHSSFEATVFQRGHHSHLALEAPVRQRGHSVPIAQPSMANAAPRRRRSSRIARRVKLRATPPRRRPLCSVHEDFDFWSNIWTLLIDLLQYVSPGWLPNWTTWDRLWQTIWDFQPNGKLPHVALWKNTSSKYLNMMLPSSMVRTMGFRRLVSFVLTSFLTIHRFTSSFFVIFPDTIQ